MSDRIQVGWTGAVRSKKWYNRDIGHRWWITVIDVTPCGRWAKVGGNAGFGRPRWVESKSISTAYTNTSIEIPKFHTIYQ